MNKIGKKEQRKRRHSRIRSKIKGTASIPRLSVYKSNRKIYAQLIDDEAGMTLAHSTDTTMPGSKGKRHPRGERARQIGIDIAKQAKIKKIKTGVFDRGGFKYIGIIRALAEGAREGGLKL